MIGNSVLTLLSRGALSPGLKQPVTSDSTVPAVSTSPAAPTPAIDLQKVLSATLPTDVYHGAGGGSSTDPPGQAGVGAYITVQKNTDMTALTYQWFSLSFSGLGTPSGALRIDYQSAI